MPVTVTFTHDDPEFIKHQMREFLGEETHGGLVQNPDSLSRQELVNKLKADLAEDGWGLLIRPQSELDEYDLAQRTVTTDTEAQVTHYGEVDPETLTPITHDEIQEVEDEEPGKSNGTSPDGSSTATGTGSNGTGNMADGTAPDEATLKKARDDALKILTKLRQSGAEEQLEATNNFTKEFGVGRFKEIPLDRSLDVLASAQKLERKFYG